MNVSPALRSQTPFGNALVPATPLRLSASKASVRRTQAPSATPQGLNHSAQGWRSSAYPGFIEKKRPNPERVESSFSRKRDATPSGLASLVALPRVGAAAEPARQPWAELSQRFQRCPSQDAPRSQTPFGNALVPATPLHSRAFALRVIHQRPAMKFGKK